LDQAVEQNFKPVAHILHAMRAVFAPENNQLMCLAALPVRPWLCCPLQAARDFAAGLPAAELHTVEGGYHDLLSGAQAQQHVAGIAGWINRSFSMLN
jgi:hypothetical protein